jgi:hypothetical protein
MHHRRVDVKVALDECRRGAHHGGMSDTKKDEGAEVRRSVRLRPEDVSRLDALAAVYRAKTRLDVSDNDAIRLALADACKVHRCEPTPPEVAPAPGDAS